MTTITLNDGQVLKINLVKRESFPRAQRWVADVPGDWFWAYGSTKQNAIAALKAKLETRHDP